MGTGDVSLLGLNALPAGTKILKPYMNSQASEILSLILNLTRNIEKEFNDRLPRKIGVLAKQHFRDNFRKSGFVDGGVRPWQKAQREGGTSTSSRYRTLTCCD